jgi:hypothetical protein
MRRLTETRLLLAMFAVGIGLGAAPAPAPAPAPFQGEGPPPPPNAAKAAASYYSVTKAIDDAVRPWDQPDATVPPAAPGWREFFAALKGELATYAASTNAKARATSLDRLYKLDVALWGVAWDPAVQVRSALDEWLAPRVRLAWAERRLFDYVEAHQADSAGSTEHSTLWKKFVDDDLGAALAAYEGAKTVQARRSALKRLTGVLALLRKNNQSVSWTYSWELQSAVDSLYNLPNLDVSADLASVSPFLSNNVVTSGPVYRRGYVSQVTAGPKTGFGLLSSDEGIAFYNSQLASTDTPITDFQQQIEQDRRGQKIAKLYYFTAESYDAPHLTITSIIRPSTGLTVFLPDYTHSVTAAFNALPIEGKGLARGVLAIIGLNRQKLVDKVGQQALPRMQKEVVQEALDEAAQRIPGAQAQENAKLRKVLVGNNTAAVKDFRITELLLRSRPENVLVSGKLGHATLPDAVGADMPRPSHLKAPNAGVSANVHVSSALSNVVAGLLRSDQVRTVENVMVVVKPAKPGAPLKEGMTIGTNVDYPTFLKTIDEPKSEGDASPKVMAIRVKKPANAPEFATNDRGYLVVLVRDFMMDVPAPAATRAKVLRFLAPTAEFILSYKVASNGSSPPTELDVKVEDFVHSTNSKVQTLLDDESKPTTMGPFQANLAFLGFKASLQQLPIKVPLSTLNIPGFSLTEISPLDPSGWLRVVLTPNGTPINLQAKPASAITPLPGPGPSPSPTAAMMPAVAR